jgi:membrane protease YdiL (CAAX protease family)
MALLNSLGFLLVLSSVAVGIGVLNRLRSGRSILESEPRLPVPWRALDLYVVLILYLCLQIGCAHLVAYVMGIDANASLQDPTPQTLSASLISNTLANLLVMLSSITYLRPRCGPAVGDLGFLPWRPLKDLTIGLLAFALAFAPVFAIQFLATQLIPYEHPVMDLLTKSASPRMLSLCVISAVIVAPLVEEFLFRVLLQGWMESIVLRRLEQITIEPTPPPQFEATLAKVADASNNPYAPPMVASGTPPTVRTGVVPKLMVLPIVASSLAFALVHFSNGPAPIPLFALALVLGYLYQKTHRIWPSVVVHACLNGWSVAALWGQQA